jgi:energy-coupling factor transporter ATP-binding protein EcfA2
VHLEQHNLQQLDQLNQRGGHTLSIIDLIQASTITLDMAAFCMMEMQHGSHLIVGAKESGSGKTALMTALLGLLPPQETITTVSGQSQLALAAGGELPTPTTMLAHEICASNYFSYIAGAEAAGFMRLSTSKYRCVTCLHADTPDEARELLVEHGVNPEDLRRITLQIFIMRGRQQDHNIHRVTAVWCFMDGRLQQIHRFRVVGNLNENLVDAKTVCRELGIATRRASTDVARQWMACKKFLSGLLEENIWEFVRVRQRAARFYEQ